MSKKKFLFIVFSVVVASAFLFIGGAKKVEALPTIKQLENSTLYVKVYAEGDEDVYSKIQSQTPEQIEQQQYVYLHNRVTGKIEKIEVEND